MKNKMFKRILAFILCAVTLFGASPAAFADQYKGGYSYNKEGDYYYVEDKKLINETMSKKYIDENFSTAMTMCYNSLYFMFESEGKKWLINMVKGQYGFIFVGTEVGVYTAEGDVTSYGDFNFAQDSDMVDIQLECLWDKDSNGNPDEIFSLPREKYRFAHIIKRGNLTYFDDIGKELVTKVKFGFNSEEAANSFVESVKKAHFIQATAESALVGDSFFVNGKSVTLMWKSLNYYEPCKLYTLEKTELTLAYDEIEIIDVKYNGFTHYPPEITWESSDESVATVDESGVVTAVDYGEAEIYARANGELIDICNVNVEDCSIRCAYEKVKNAVIGFVADYMLKILVFYYR